MNIAEELRKVHEELINRKSVSHSRLQVIRDAAKRLDDTSFKDRLIAVDKDRFKTLIQPLSVTDTCEGCYYWDKDLGTGRAYRCATMGNCIGVTLSERIKGYLRDRIL